MASSLKERREASGTTQATLAHAAGISRQALFAIESGGATPSVTVALALAAALGTTVEELFGPREAIVAHVANPNPTSRAVVARIGERWVAHGLGARDPEIAADALTTKDGTLDLLRPAAAVADTVIVMGCAPVLGAIVSGMAAERDLRFVWLPRSSSEALAALEAGTTHVAGFHLGRAPRAGAMVVTLAHWEVGLLVAKGNPKRVRGAADLARRGMRVVTREKGSGARAMLEHALRRAGAPVALAAAKTVALGHREVAQCVASGAADVGPGVRDVALTFDLDFVSLGSERFDLAIPQALAGDRRIERFLDALVTRRVRRELEALGYDAAATGARA
jgi:molybdate-binding protein/DNA-binding XRE family transcriptional regulator